MGLLLGNIVLLSFFTPALMTRADNQLRTTGNLVVMALPKHTASPPSTRGLPQPSGADLLGDIYVAHVSADGRIERTETAGTGGSRTPPPQLPDLSAAAVRERASRPFTTGSTRGPTEWRVLLLPKPSWAAGGSVVIAGKLDHVNATIKGVRGNSVALSSALLPVLSLMGFFAIRAGLRPLRKIEETAEAIAAGDLSRRVPGSAAANTEMDRLSTALNGMLQRIEAAVAARTDSEARMRRFVADASHELRTPLAGISGFAELYRMGALSDQSDVDRTMDRIEREADRLTRLVEDLLLLAQLDEHEVAGTALLRVAPMDLRAVAVDALHDLRALDPSRHVTLTGLDGGQIGVAPVLGDEARLRQVVTNLVGNAIAHTPAGSAVEIRVGTSDGESILEVADEGTGISPEHAERIFRRFYRSDDARNRSEADGRTGAGLGLAIAQSLVVAHEGSLSVHTAPGEGATFRITLPLGDQG
ncbi:sensor histidine kinase [Streptomyces sp. DT224]|uniref:sensor histidine kinase n=1 Tax=Streptomyces sp. DT224 TaxID=3393426 RepID=UPI003CE6CA66